MESKASESILGDQKRRRVIFDYRDNRHTDSRARFPEKVINFSAYESVQSNKQGLLDGFAWIHRQYSQDIPLGQITYEQANDITSIGTWLPAYLVHRAWNSLSKDDLPDVIADLSKVSEGLRATSNREILLDNANAQATAEGIYNIADEDRPIGSLLVLDDEVCPAPKSVILEVANAMLSGRGGHYEDSALGVLVPTTEFDSLKEFSCLADMYERDNAIATLRIRLEQELITQMIEGGDSFLSLCEKDTELERYYADLDRQ